MDEETAVPIDARTRLETTDESDDLDMFDVVEAALV